MANQFKPTQIQLILAAERLFAEQGMDAVPLSSIASHAGQANNTAVHYHFGSREALITAISRYRTQKLDQIRAQMLDDLPCSERECDLRALLGILFLSQLEMVDERNRHPYAHFMVQYLTRDRPAGVPHASDNPDADSQALHRLIGLIEHQLPDLSPTLVRQRLERLNLCYLAVLVRNDNAALHGQCCPPLEIEVSEMIEMTVAALQAPASRRVDTALSADGRFDDARP